MQKYVLALLVATANARTLKHHNKGHIKSMRSFKDEMALKGVKHARNFFEVIIREENVQNATDTYMDMEDDLNTWAAQENTEIFVNHVAEDITDLQNSDEVAALMAWKEANSDSTNWDDNTKEVIAEYESHLIKVQATGQALEEYYEPIAANPTMDNADLEIIGDEPHRTLSVEIPDAQWNAFNDEVAATKAFELQTLKNLPLVKEFRQHLLNIKFSDSFKSLEGDFQQFTGNSQIRSYTRSYEKLIGELKALPVMTEEAEAAVSQAAIVQEVCLMMDLTLDSMKTGSMDKIADYLINGETDGVLTETVDAPQTQVSTNETAPETNANSNATNNTNNTSDKASGLFAAVTTAVVAFAATQF